MIGIWLKFIIPLQKFGGAPPKKFGAKNMQNFGQFWNTSDFDREYLQKTGKAEDIQNWPALQTMAISPAFNEKSPVNFGPLTAWNYM